MSAIGLPMAGHCVPHFNAVGMCQCPCDQCTTRLAEFCVCLDCPCDDLADHAPGRAALRRIDPRRSR